MRLHVNAVFALSEMKPQTWRGSGSAAKNTRVFRFPKERRIQTETWLKRSESGDLQVPQPPLLSTWYTSSTFPLSETLFAADDGASPTGQGPSGCCRQEASADSQGFCRCYTHLSLNKNQRSSSRDLRLKGEMVTEGNRSRSSALRSGWNRHCHL